MLRADLDAPRKQRHSATRILARLIDEHAATDLSCSTVRDYVRIRRAQIDLEAGRRVEDVFIAQDHAPGQEAEVDFGEVYVVLGGVKTKCHMFVFWLSLSAGWGQRGRTLSGCSRLQRPGRGIDCGGQLSGLALERSIERALHGEGHV